MLLPKTDSGSLQFGWSYSLTPRTTVLGGVAETQGSYRTFRTDHDAIKRIHRANIDAALVRSGERGVGFITRPKRQQPRGYPANARAVGAVQPDIAFARKHLSDRFRAAPLPMSTASALKRP